MRHFSSYKNMTARARELRQDATPAEQRLWTLVRNRGCFGHKIQRQVPAGHFVLDFYCAEARLAIELDGGVHELPERRERDWEREKILHEELQIEVFRLPNDDVLHGSPTALLARIDRRIQEALATVAPLGQRPARRR